MNFEVLYLMVASMILLVIPLKSAAFSWSLCDPDPTNDIIELKAFKITPGVISLSSPIIISMQALIKEDLSGPIRVTMSVTKDSGMFKGHEIPCEMGKFGSCTFDDICSKFSIDCPIKAGPHEVKGFNYKLPEMSAFMRWMAEGNYQGRIAAKDGNGRQLGCVTMSLEITS